MHESNDHDRNGRIKDNVARAQDNVHHPIW